MPTLKSKWTSPSGFSRWCSCFGFWLVQHWSRAVGQATSGRRLRWSLTGFCRSFTAKWINPMTWWHRLAIRPTNSVQLTPGQDMCKSSFDLPVPPLKWKSRWWKSCQLNFSPWDSSWLSTAVGQATSFWVWGDCAGPSPVSAKVSEQNEFDMQTNSLQVTNSIWKYLKYFIKFLFTCATTERYWKILKDTERYWKILKDTERGNCLRSYFALSSLTPSLW